MKWDNGRTKSMWMKMFLILVGLCMGAVFTSTALGFTVNLDVQGLPKSGTGPGDYVPIPSYRWLIEEDTTHR